MLLSVVAAALGSASCLLVETDAVVAETRDVRVDELVSPACLEGETGAAAAARTVVRLPAQGVRLERTALAALLRRAAPSLRVATGGDGAIFLRAAPADVTPPALFCARAARALRAGEPIFAGDVTSAPCDADAPRAPRARFDRARGQTRAIADIAQGAALGRVAPAPRAAIEPGDDLVLGGAHGRVSVRRTVTALERAAPGQPLFLMTQDGAAIVATAPLQAPDRPETSHLMGAPAP